jgi:hypothetical protein
LSSSGHGYYRKEYTKRLFHRITFEEQKYRNEMNVPKKTKAFGSPKAFEKFPIFNNYNNN